jgi:hypothetical protein
MTRVRSRQARHFARDNKKRADIVGLALQHIARQHQARADAPIRPIRTHEDYETALVDLLANIRHFCDSKQIAFHEADAAAHRHYTSEVVQARTGVEQ